MAPHAYRPADKPQPYKHAVSPDRPRRTSRDDSGTASPQTDQPDCPADNNHPSHVF